MDFTLFLGLLDVAVLVHDEHGALRYHNERARALLGLAPEALHSPIEDAGALFYADQRPCPPPERPVARARATGQPVRGQLLRLPRPEGPCWLRVSAIPVLGPREEVRRVIVSVEDVTTEHLQRESMRLLAQRELQARGLLAAQHEREILQHRLDLQAHAEQARLYQAVIQAMAEGVVVHNPDGTLRSANPSAEQVLGLSFDQMQGRAALDPRWRLLRADGSPLPPAEIPSEITARTGAPVSGARLQVARGDGSRAWLSVSTRAIEDQPQEGARVAVVATFYDLTAEIEAREALQQSRAAFQSVTEAVPGVLFQLEAPRHQPPRFRFVSQHCLPLLGVSAAQALQDPETFWACISHRERQAARQALQDAGRTGSPWCWDALVRHPDGARRWVRCRAVLDWLDGLPVWSGLVLDVTEERRLGEQLQHAHRAESIHTVVAGLAQSLLRPLEDALRHLDTARLGPPQAPRALDQAHEATRAALDLLRPLPALLQPNPASPPAPCVCFAVVGFALALSRPLFPPSARLLLSQDAEAGLAFASPAPLQQALLHLLVNARDATAGLPSPVITLSLRHLAAPGEPPSLAISVRDNGPGMSQDALRRAGDPFFTTKPQGQGAGLGLASVYATARALGGRVEVSSSEEHGTEVTLHLPSADPRPTPPRVAARVLLVNEDPMARSALRRALRSQEFEVETTASCAEVPARLCPPHPPVEAVVVDLSAPRGAQREALQALLDQRLSLPVLVLSGDLEEDSPPRGAVECLHKPIRADQLAEALRRHLR